LGASCASSQQKPATPAAQELGAIDNAVGTFVKAALDEDRDRAAAVCVSRTDALDEAFDYLPELGGVKKLGPVEYYADANAAFAVTQTVTASDGWSCRLLFTLAKHEGEWLISDIDIEEPDDAVKEIRRFTLQNPGAQALLVQYK
jgi:hypothetical protein